MCTGLHDNASETAMCGRVPALPRLSPAAILGAQNNASLRQELESSARVDRADGASN